MSGVGVGWAGVSGAGLRVARGNQKQWDRDEPEKAKRSRKEAPHDFMILQEKCHSVTMGELSNKIRSLEAVRRCVENFRLQGVY
jgi:hypothetical protein